MIDPAAFYAALSQCGVSFFAGVPDSLLKQFCGFVSDNCPKANHVICANEGNAVAMGVGSYLATGKVPLIYMQNSGLGNAINPLMSLADKEVYAIPLILLIGWRGEPGIKDEPQHLKQGRVQLALLEAMEIPYKIISANSTDYAEIVRDLAKEAKQSCAPMALVVRKGTFADYKTKASPETAYTMSREEALHVILETDSSDCIVSTTGKTSRELYELRKKRGSEKHDFLTVGSMGHSSSIAAAIALTRPEIRVLCIDGDGALIMHMGAMAVIGKLGLENFVHLVINNFCHESVGGQATAAEALDMEHLAKASGYRHYYRVAQIGEFRDAMLEIKDLSGPILVEVRVKKGSRADLGRPQSSPQENKKAFMRQIR